MHLCKLSVRLEKLNFYERIGSWLAGVRQVLDVHGKFLSTREAYEYHQVRLLISSLVLSKLRSALIRRWVNAFHEPIVK